MCESAAHVRWATVREIEMRTIHIHSVYFVFFFFFQAEDGIRDYKVTGFRRVLFRSIVSTTVVFGCFSACLTGMNCPEPASRPIFFAICGVSFPRVERKAPAGIRSELRDSNPCSPGLGSGQPFRDISFFSRPPNSTARANKK